MVTNSLLPSAVDAELRDAVSREVPVLAAELDDANAIHDAIEPQEDDCKAAADAAQEDGAPHRSAAVVITLAVTWHEVARPWIGRPSRRLSGKSRHG